MSHYQYHIFMCSHERESGKDCCGQQGRALELLAYAKNGLKQRQNAGLIGKRCRINKSGCMDRCPLGPLLVVYPLAVWYHYKNEHDLDEIIDRHLAGGEIVERLQIKR